MHISKAILIAAMGGAGHVAGRNIHNHRHADLHKRAHEAQAQARGVGDWVIDVIDGVKVSWINEYEGGSPATTTSFGGSATAAATTTAVTTSATTTKAAPATVTYSATSTAPSATASSTEATTYKEFCGDSSKKRATDAEITYMGNTGNCGWGSNMMLVSESVADKYEYTVKVTGDNTVDWTFICWNKMGPDGKTDGWYGHKAIEFTLAPGATQYIAFEKNSQGGCAAAEGDSIPTDQYGAWAATWYEFDFCNESNNGWTGGDVSSIIAQKAGLIVQGMHACYDGTCSTIGAALSVITNAFSAALAEADGLGLNIPSSISPIRINVVVDYSS